MKHALAGLPRRLRPLLPALAVAGLALAAWALRDLARTVHPAEIGAALRAIPPRRLAAALALTAANYAVLTLYDVLALRYAGQRLPYRRSALASFCGYAVSIALGHAVVTGGAVRARLYGRWGVPSEAVGQVIGFCGLAFWMGFLSLGAVVLLVAPLRVPASFPVPARALGAVLGAAFLLYLGLNAWRKAPLRLWRWQMTLPGVRTTLAQAAVASADLALAAAVLAVLLPVDGPPLGHVLSGYLLALIAGVLSAVPGGFGVFDGLMASFLAPPLPAAVAVAVLVAYRALYTLLPFALALAVLGGVEFRARRAVAP